VLTFDAEVPLSAAAGQFAMVRSATWGEAPLLPRPMSLLTAGARPSILIKVIGEGTRRMAHASPGEPFHVLAPLGKPWSTPPADRRPVLVAGGVGVAPLVYFARELARANRATRALALYGGRSDHDLPLDVELAEVAELKVATEDGSRGLPGRVTALLEAELARAEEPLAVYTCGPDAMMAAVVRICEAAKVPCEVSLETPMACGYGVCLGCPVPKRGGGFLYACTEGPCVDAARIDWSRGHGR
jgi:dihydroorotate dehydrogenase electron transfer subunit